MGAMASQITSLTIVYSTVYSGADQRKHQSSASLAIVLGIHRWPGNSPHKGPVTRKMLPFDDVIMKPCDFLIDVFAPSGRDKIVDILTMRFSHPFSCMKVIVFWFKFHPQLLLWVQWTISQPWFISVKFLSDKYIAKIKYCSVDPISYVY